MHQSVLLQVGRRYYARVTAQNIASLNGYVSSPVFLVVKDTRLTSAAVALIVAGSIIAAVLLCAVGAWYLLEARLVL